MKPTPEQLQKFREQRGIRAEDLLSAADLTLADLPPDVTLTDIERDHASQLVTIWNGLGVLDKIEAAHAAERLALGKHSSFPRCAAAWAAFLMLGRIRGCAERQKNMATLGCGVTQLTRTRLTRDERQRGLTCDKYEITRPSGETFTMYHPK